MPSGVSTVKAGAATPGSSIGRTSTGFWSEATSLPGGSTGVIVSSAPLIEGRAMYHWPSIRKGSARLNRSGERNSLSPSFDTSPLKVPSPSRSTQSSTIRRVRSPLAGTVKSASLVCSTSTIGYSLPSASGVSPSSTVPSRAEIFANEKPFMSGRRKMNTR